jgi:putative iron-dependent peroxidase
MASQPGILDPVPATARYVTLALTPAADPRAIVDRVRALHVDPSIVVGLGAPLVHVAGLRPFPAIAGAGVAIPSTQGALWLQTRGTDPGDTLRTMRRALAHLGDGLRIDEDVLAYKHDIGRDLSGFEDGTENPTGDKAVAAALASDASFVATQRWIHDLARFDGFDARTRDRLIGRNRETNVELADAPASAHVKRAAQESFEPPAFMVRRSMPFGGVAEHGLYFVAYVASLDRFEAVLRRMVGLDDGIVDGLFQFSRPISGGYFWCPPVVGAHLSIAG